MKRFECLPLRSELKKQIDIAKGQYKFLKDQINVINNNSEDGVQVENGVKTEDGDITDNVYHKYFVDEYKNLINNILT